MPLPPGLQMAPQTGVGEAAGREGVKRGHNYQFETFSKIAAFLLFAEFPMLLQCYSHYSFLSQNNILSRRMTWVGRRGDLQADWDSCMPLCLQWGIFQYFRQFCFFTGKPSNSSLSPCFPGASAGKCAHAVDCFYSPAWKEASLAGGCSFEEEGKDAFGKITLRSLAPGLVMQADPTEVGCRPQSTLCVPPLTAGPRKQLLWRGSLTAPTRAPLPLTVRHAAKHKQGELQKQVPAAFP